MKIRKGFISNSSTTSFLIWGVHEPNLSVSKAFDNIGLSTVKRDWEQKKEEDSYLIRDFDTFEEWLEFAYDEDAINEDEGMAEFFSWTLPKIIKDFPNLDFEHGYDTIYIGLSPITMKDNQTLGEWKQSINNEIAKVVNDDFKCNWHEEAWRFLSLFIHGRN